MISHTGKRALQYADTVTKQKKKKVSHLPISPPLIGDLLMYPAITHPISPMGFSPWGRPTWMSGFDSGTTQASRTFSAYGHSRLPSTDAGWRDWRPLGVPLGGASELLLRGAVEPLGKAKIAWRVYTVKLDHDPRRAEARHLPPSDISQGWLLANAISCMV